MRWTTDDGGDSATGAGGDPGDGGGAVAGAGGDPPSEGRRLARRLEWLRAFAETAVDETRDWIDDLERRHDDATSEAVARSIEQLYVDARDWLDTAERLRGRLIVWIRDASVQIKRARERGRTPAVEHELRRLLESVNELIELSTDECLALLGKGTYERIQERTAAAFETEAETESETAAEGETEELAEMQRDLEDLITDIETDDREADEPFRLE